VRVFGSGSLPAFSTCPVTVDYEPMRLTTYRTDYRMYDQYGSNGESMRKDAEAVERPNHWTRF